MKSAKIIRRAKTDKHGRQLTRNPSEDKAFVNFWGTIDSEEVREALAASDNQRFQHLAEAMVSPTYKTYSLTTICYKLGVTLNEMVDVWRNLKMAQGTVRMVNHVPQVMEDVAVDSKSRLVVCQVCQGKAGEEICGICEGTGKVREVGDKAAREILFESLGLIRKPRGPLVAFQQNFGTGLGTVIEQTDKLLESAK